jgi:hypothetical protein
MSSFKAIASAAIAMFALLPVAGALASTPPPPQPLQPTVLKWILPPRTSDFYLLEKKRAQEAGYETVEHDDLSYPG